VQCDAGVFFAHLFAGAAVSACTVLFEPAAALAAAFAASATAAPVVRDFGRRPPATCLPRVWSVVLRRRPGAAGAFGATGFAETTLAAGAFFWIPRVVFFALLLAGGLPLVGAVLACGLPLVGVIPLACALGFAAARLFAAGSLLAAAFAFVAELGLNLAEVLVAAAGRTAVGFFFAMLRCPF
jgi:hypothetical protein